MTSGSPAATAATLTATLGLAAAAWVVAVRQMNGMDMGVATELVSFGFFAARWVSMMAAMMPGAVPAAGDPLNPDPQTALRERRPITMPAIIALALIAIVALTIASITVHVLLSPWLLAVIAILAWINFRPRRSRR